MRSAARHPHCLKLMLKLIKPQNIPLNSPFFSAGKKGRSHVPFATAKDSSQNKPVLCKILPLHLSPPFCNLAHGFWTLSLYREPVQPPGVGTQSCNKHRLMRNQPMAVIHGKQVGLGNFLITSV